MNRSSKIAIVIAWAACLLIVALVWPESTPWGQMATLKRLREVQADGIEQINLYDDSFRRVVRVVDDRQAIGEFAQSCRDVEYYAPGYSDSITSDFNLTVEANPRIELHFWYDQRIPDYVVGYIVRNSFPPEGGRHQAIIGSFKSKRLRSWLDGNLVHR